MKIVRILFYILLLLFFVFLFILGGLYIFLDPNRLKPEIIERVRKNGYVLVIDGDIGWSIYPKIGIKIKHMTLSAPNNSPFFELSDVSASTDFSQLFYRGAKLRGELRSSQVRLFHLHATNGYIAFGWENNILTLHPITADIYGGKLSAILHGRELTASPKWDWSMNFKNLQIRKLLEDVNYGEGNMTISGIGDLTMTGTSQGLGNYQMVRHVYGTSQFTIHDGVIEGVDLDYFVQAADAIINKQPIPLPPSVQRTNFESLTGTASSKDGIGNVYILLTTKTLTTQTTGGVDLPNRTMNFEMKINTQTTQRRWEIPLLITGSFAHPDVRLDLDAIQKQIVNSQVERVKEQVKDKVDKVKEDIRTRIPDKANDLLQKLIGH